MAEQDIPPPTAMKIPIIRKGESEKEPPPTGETSLLLLLRLPTTGLLERNHEREAIKSRFDGNVESKKMQKNVLKHQFENFSTASNENLDKAYDRFQKLISQLEVHGAPISKEDINQKFLRKEFEKVSVPNTTSQNLAYLPLKYSKYLMKLVLPVEDFGNEEFQQWIGEVLGGIGSSMAGGYVDCQSKEVHSEDRKEFGLQRKTTYLEGIKGEDLMVTMAGAMHSTNKFYITGTDGSRWSRRLWTGSIGTFLTPRADISFAGLDEYAIRNKIIKSQTTELNIKTNDANTEKPKSASESVVSNPKIDRDRVIIEDWNSDDEEEVNEVQTVRPETQTVKTRDDKSGQNSQKQGISFRKVKACFVCKSTEHLIKDCNFHDKKSQEPKLKNVVNTGQREGKPVWDNTKRVNHQNFSKYPHLSKTFVPSGVLTRTGLHRPSVSTARPVYATRPIYLRMDNEIQDLVTRSCSGGLWVALAICWQQSIIFQTIKNFNGALWLLEVIPKENKCFASGGNLFNMQINSNESKLRHRRIRFSWVFFLATKDETSEILCNLIIGLENQLSHNVKIIRCDNGTEFKNHAMNEFCAKKGIKREFSVARTPQQNGVAERKNRTLIEAARTMLADSLLPIPFWAEAVNTACYVLNRVLVTKPQNKTPYELLIGKSPSISFMRPFGCPLTILNTLDSLGKFDGKSNEGYLLGYSTSSKAFRVYNKRTKRVEENLHINFLEDQPNVTGTGPN
ncbi:retrovirus-related pol polyprotein from transposon TNT 1-94 [Tanacetum coccineum]